MANYRYATLTFRDRTKHTYIVEESEFDARLVHLERAYGVKVKMGRRLNKAEVAYLERVQSQQLASRKGAEPARPLSPDFGRGSGAPI